VTDVGCRRFVQGAVGTTLTARLTLPAFASRVVEKG